MTHISGPINWTDAIYEKYEVEGHQLILYLLDGSIRKMNLNWDGINKTIDNLNALVKGQAIRYATWLDYGVDEWFCDVEVK